MKYQVGTVKELWRYPVKSMQGEQLDKAVIESQGVVGDRYWITRDDTQEELITVRKKPGLMHCTARYEEEPVSGQQADQVPDVQISLPDGSSFSTGEGSTQQLSDFLNTQVSLWPLQPKKDQDFYSLKSEIGLREVRRQFNIKGKLPNMGSMSWSKVFELSRFVTPRGRFYDAYPLHIVTSNAIDKLKSLEPDGDFNVQRFRPNLYIDSTNKSPHIQEWDWLGGKLFIGDTVIYCDSRTIRCSMPSQPQRELEKDSRVVRTLEKHTGRHLGINAEVIKPGKINQGDAVYWQPESAFALRKMYQPISDRVKDLLIKRLLKNLDRKKA